MLLPIAVAKQYTTNAIPKSVFTAGVSEDEAAAAINTAYEAYGIKATIPVSARDKISIQKNINFGTDKEAEWVTITDWLTNYEGIEGEKKHEDAMEAINGVLSTYDAEVIQQINQRTGSSGGAGTDTSQYN